MKIKRWEWLSVVYFWRWKGRSRRDEGPIRRYYGQPLLRCFQLVMTVFLFKPEGESLFSIMGFISLGFLHLTTSLWNSHLLRFTCVYCAATGILNSGCLHIWAPRRKHMYEEFPTLLYYLSFSLLLPCNHPRFPGMLQYFSVQTTIATACINDAVCAVTRVMLHLYLKTGWLCHSSHLYQMFLCDFIPL